MTILEKLLLPEIRELIHSKDLDILRDVLNRWLPADLARPDLAYAARLWPHQVTGEGHFVALLQRAEGPKPSTPWADLKDAPRPVRAAWRAFVQATLEVDPVEDAVLTTRGAHVYALPTKPLDLERVKTVRAGLWLGTLERDRFEPSHSLALALSPAELPPHPSASGGSQRGVGQGNSDWSHWLGETL